MCPVSDEWANLTFLHLKIFRFFNVSWILFKDRPTLHKTGFVKLINLICHLSFVTKVGICKILDFLILSGAAWPAIK